MQPLKPSKPLLLDLFCGAGGAARGYQRAGFEVWGCDVNPQPRYAGDLFFQMGAFEFLGLFGFLADAIHASPPCQRFTKLQWMYNAKAHEDLLTPTKAALLALDKPYVIENVPGAPMSGGHIILCGSMFGLGTETAELRRHRLFEVYPVWMLAPPCAHRQKPRVIGVYGGHGRDRRRTGVNRGNQDFPVGDRRVAMGIDWMTDTELSQSIPPAYTEYIGRQLMPVVMRRLAVAA